MNTLRAFQGVDTAFSVTLSPPSVDFPSAPALIAEVHKGDGRPALITLTPTWQLTATDTITVPFPGTTLPPGNYILSLRLADSSAYLSWDALVIYPGTSGASAIRSLIAPSDAIGMIPDFKDDLGQMDGLPYLLVAATVACEQYCDIALALTDFDYLTRHERHVSINLRGRPVYDFQLRTNPGTVVGNDISLFTDVQTEYWMDSYTGNVEFFGQPGTFLTDYGHIWVGRHNRSLVRLTYRGGYAIEPSDVVIGIDPVPGELQSACLMTAISIRESSRTAGPTMQQGRGGSYYTKNVTEQAVPTPARALLDQYSRAWGVA